MPLVLAKAKKVVEKKAPTILHHNGVKFWGRPEGDVRYICATSKYAIYVIEEKPGKRTINCDYGKLRLWFPWIYFFIKVPSDLKTSTYAPAYILVSRTRQETLEEKTLMVPYLPNLFAHGGICPNHDTPLRAQSPVVLARKFINWFWKSPGSIIFEDTNPPADVDGKGRSIDIDDEVFEVWKEATPERVLKFEFEAARYASVKEAAHRLRFDYWRPSHAGFATNDMELEPAKFRRIKIKSEEEQCR